VIHLKQVLILVALAALANAAPAAWPETLALADLVTHEQYWFQTSAPEPSAVALMLGGIALIAVGVCRNRRRRAQNASIASATAPAGGA
jgi:hypothetical protein